MTDRLFSAWRVTRFFGVVALALAAGCHGPDDAPIPDLGTDAAMPLPADLADPRPDAAADLGAAADLSIPADLSTPADLAITLPPPACNMRTPGVTAILAVLHIDSYGGLQTGHNGVHELAEGTLVTTTWVYDKTLVDTSNVHLAMNVASDTDPAGLPMEIPLAAGTNIELEGEYIPAATAGYTNPKGPAAVVHFTHSPCGYVVIGGTTYH